MTDAAEVQAVDRAAVAEENFRKRAARNQPYSELSREPSLQSSQVKGTRDRHDGQLKHGDSSATTSNGRQQ